MDVARDMDQPLPIPVRNTTNMFWKSEIGHNNT